VGLRLRLFLVLIVPLALVVGVYGFVRIRQEEAQLLAEEQRNPAVVAKAVQIAVENALRDRQISDVRRLLAEMVDSQTQIHHIRVFDRALAPTLVSDATEPAVPRDALERVVASATAETALDETGDPPLLLHLVPLRGRGGEARGAMEIAFVTGGVAGKVRAATRDIAVRVGILTLVLALLTAVVLQRQVLRPLSRLTESIQALGEGRPGLPLPVERADELGAVAEAFNRMAERLAAARQHILGEGERTLELEQQLRQAETLAVAGKLTSGIAHEVGTPLNIISGRAEILLRALPAGHQARPDLEVIVNQIDRISGIIRSLLDSVRLQKPEIQAVALTPLLDRLLPLLDPAARRRGIAMRTRVAPDLPAVAADPNQLQQVLINLVMNAIEATPREGRITVEALAQPHDGRPGVALAVTDTGSGIPPEALKKIFDPFYTTKPPGQGTGLGLAICRDLVRDHGGTLHVESRPGEGATFTVWLPRHAEAA
jgi:two-component system, NtrC family, sensor kinase